tara:strand:+ start:266 stop:565 length:300 start_codon:yes stop_codon:yes gene_type:complete
MIAVALVALVPPANADLPSQGAACEAVVADESRRKAIFWLEDRVDALRQLENPSDGEVTLLNEFESTLSKVHARATPDREPDSPGCEPDDTSGQSDLTS